MENSLLNVEELKKKFFGFSVNYFLVDVRHDRESYYALTDEELKGNAVCISGIFLNKIMEGDLDAAWDIIEKIPEDFPNPLLKPGLIIVHPNVTWKQFMETIEYLKSMKQSLYHVILTAGRPSLLNGLHDFSRLGSFLERQKDNFIEDLKILYEGNCVPCIYKLCLAEYKYQKNELMDAEILVSTTISELDRNSERRLLFLALYLQSKILLAHNNSLSAESFITNIRQFTKKEGEAEFSHNIEAAYVLFSLYEGKSAFAVSWLTNDAPDEFSDFNMLDLYRYMIKIRCYIIIKNYEAVIALAERLRPLLERGRRVMDLCELNLLLAIAFYRAGKKELAFENLEGCLKTVRRQGYFRLVADEGEAIMPLLTDYANEKFCNSDVRGGEKRLSSLMKLIEETRNMAIYHPLYLKGHSHSEESFTQMEADILRLLEQGKSKEEIGKYFFISVNTVKYHLKKIYAKLGVSSAHHAVWEGRVRKII